MQVSDVNVDEGSTVHICANLTGRFLDTTEDIVVELNFIDTVLAGNNDNGITRV